MKHAAAVFHWNEEPAAAKSSTKERSSRSAALCFELELNDIPASESLRLGTTEVSGMLHRCQVCYLVVGISSEFQQKGDTEMIPIQRVKPLRRRKSSITIVLRLFHQTASVITCQKKRKEPPRNELEALEMSPDV